MCPGHMYILYTDTLMLKEMYFCCLCTGVACDAANFKQAKKKISQSLYYLYGTAL